MTSQRSQKRHPKETLNETLNETLKTWSTKNQLPTGVAADALRSVMASFYEILMTPTFQMHEIDLLSDFWAKLREARGSVKWGDALPHDTDWNGGHLVARAKGLAGEKGPARPGYIGSGQAVGGYGGSTCPLPRESLEELEVMRKAERQQMPGFMFFFGLEEWLEQEIQFPQWWFLNWDCTTEFMDIWGYLNDILVRLEHRWWSNCTLEPELFLLVSGSH